MRKVERTRLRPLASGRVSLESAWLLIAALCIIGLVVLLQLNLAAAIVALGQHRAGRRLPVHEAHHLVAAGVARARLLLGRAGRLARSDRAARPGRPSSYGSEASPGWSATTRSTRSRISRTTRWSASNRRARRLGDKAPLGIASSTRSRCCCGARRSGRCGPTGWRCSHLLPAALHLANQALRADPKDGELALRLFRSNRTCGLLVFLGMLAVGLSSR